MRKLFSSPLHIPAKYSHGNRWPPPSPLLFLATLAATNGRQLSPPRPLQPPLNTSLSSIYHLSPLPHFNQHSSIPFTFSRRAGAAAAATAGCAMMSGGRSMTRAMEHHKLILETSSSTDSPPPPFSSSESETEEEQGEATMLPPPTMWTAGMRKRVLSKQLSMRETKREVQWEKRRRQMYQRSRSGESGGAAEEERRKQGKEEELKAARVRSLTDEDLDELRGSIELGFGFNEENGGQQLCRTLPALNLYFAVNRQVSDPKLRQTPSPASTPTATATATSSASTLYGTPSPRSPDEPPQQEQYSAGGSDDTWKIFKPGDSPQHVKMRLRHWAQIVACSVRQCC